MVAAQCGRGGWGVSEGLAAGWAAPAESGSHPGFTYESEQRRSLRRGAFPVAARQAPRPAQIARFLSVDSDAIAVDVAVGGVLASGGQTEIARLANIALARAHAAAAAYFSPRWSHPPPLPSSQPQPELLGARPVSRRPRSCRRGCRRRGRRPACSRARNTRWRGRDPLSRPCPSRRDTRARCRSTRRPGRTRLRTWRPLRSSSPGRRTRRDKQSRGSDTRRGHRSRSSSRTPRAPGQGSTSTPNPVHVGNPQRVAGLSPAEQATLLCALREVFAEPAKRLAAQGVLQLATFAVEAERLHRVTGHGLSVRVHGPEIGAGAPSASACTPSRRGRSPSDHRGKLPPRARTGARGRDSPPRLRDRRPCGRARLPRQGPASRLSPVSV